MTLRTRLTNTITATQRQPTDWLPASLRTLFRRMTGGDRAAAQLLAFQFLWACSGIISSSYYGTASFTELAHEIEFQKLSLTYPESDTPTLEQLSLTIPQGDIVAFVGTSGAGKSTLVSLLLRLYAATDGQILVDGVNLSDYQLETWRNQIGIVDQDTFVFNRSIANNICFGKAEASQYEIEEAAKIAHAHDFIMALPDGYETVVGDRGYRL